MRSIINRRWQRTSLWMVLASSVASIAFLLVRRVSWAARPTGLNLDNISPPHGHYLQKFLLPRLPGSQNHQAIQTYVADHFKAIGWHFETDRFQQNTVMGPVEFTNLIATADPSAPKRIVLAAHYDSKQLVLSDGQQVEGFIGATDSAWSCAFLLELAASLPSLLQGPKDVTLQVILFDGEEALEEWSDSDSIYGSKHLARKWSNSNLNHHSLSRIKYMMLLDLLGAPSPKLYSFFPETDIYYHKLIDMETFLRRRGKLKGPPSIFSTGSPIPGVYNGSYTMGDDHVPFAQRKVPIVHLIPYPFPSVWHQPTDDVSALDPDTCHDLALIIHRFIALEVSR